MSTATDTGRKAIDADIGPEVQVSNADTGELYPTEIRNRADQLDGAASDARWTAGDPWTPGPNTIPTHVATLLKPLSREQLDAEATPEAGNHIPSIDDLRERNRLTQASIRLLSVLDAKAEMWHEIASEAWASQGVTSRISDTYRAKAEATERAYREQCAQIWGMANHGVLSTTPRPALPVSAEPAPLPERHPARELAPERLDADAERRRKKLAPLASPPTQVAGSSPTSNETASELERDGKHASPLLRGSIAGDALRRGHARLRRAWTKVRNWDGTGA